MNVVTSTLIPEADWDFADKDEVSVTLTPASVESIKELMPIQRAAVSLSIAETPRDPAAHLIHQDFSGFNLSETVRKVARSVCPCLFKQASKGL